MNIYEVIHLIQNRDNIDKLDEIFCRWYFQTSVITPDVKAEVKKAAVEMMQIGETKLYSYILDIYGVKS
ncbi:hypothetical protein H839_01031 [Parageobacillus genomosp. 1]|jgi:hypothetical protein|uniref:Uncharacterized protein n=1 Tax=Parageobacillus genomosp. 1 TaxID=1295642 RepID=A0ABC9VIF7_9BACL|nr:hypothetical protein [Parageobacillus genomosp. 1]EZP78408.1 hypothetical protein H839_01031 [Parageobacillus genomosp. 1]